jgi:hypothetical protein
MESLSISVKQFRIFPPDVLPLALLRTYGGLEIFKNILRFRESTIEPLSGEITFSGGNTQEGGRPIAINSLQINPQRIILDVAADSASASFAFGVIAGAFAHLDQAFSPIRMGEPLLFTEETACVARLSFEWTDLLSERLTQFVLTDALSRASTPAADAKVTGMQFRLVLRFDLTNERLKDYGTALAPKVLIIEPRENVPFSEKIYYTSSPLSSDKHLLFLGELESFMAGTRRRPSRRS